MSIDRTAFNALIDDDGTNTIGSIWNKNQIKNVLLDPMDSAIAPFGLWTPYTPVWSGSDGIGPSLGNGTLVGRYARVGPSWVDVAILMVMGSTTVFGTSSYWMWTLPLAPKIFTPSSGREITFRAGAMSNAGANVASMIGYYLNNGSVYVLSPVPAPVSPTVPFTWLATANFSIRGSYEV